MRAVCLIDTSVFVELLDVPGRASNHEDSIDQLDKRIRAGESLFLPMATILETGNHIGHVSDGRLRRRCAERFSLQVRGALDGKAPFRPIRFPEAPDMAEWIDEFPESATRGLELGDLSIIKDWDLLCRQNMARRVYIWSLDGHLSGFDRTP